MAFCGETLLLFGGKLSAYLDEWEITSDLALVEHKLDVRIEDVPTETLVERLDALDGPGRAEAAQLARDLVDGALPTRKGRMPPAPPLDEIEKAARLYVAMRRIVDERDAHAVTIACGPWIGEAHLPTPCLALMRLQEEGIPATCQGDIDALLTMVLLKRVSGLPSFMGGAIKARGHLGISHCVLCRTMLGPGADLQPYAISNYHGRKESPTIWTEVPAGGPVTIVRLTRNLERLLLATGTVFASQTDNWRCRNTLVIDVPDRDRFFKAVRGIQNHYVVALGDHAAALTALAGRRGIEVERL
jgi:L-fucose isomerase-like protein